MRADPVGLPVDAERNFTDFLTDLGSSADALGISAATLLEATDGLTPDAEVLRLSTLQPENTKSTSEYLRAMVTEIRVEHGAKYLSQQGALAQKVTACYGVDHHVLFAIWGAESNYGEHCGTRSVVRSLLTLAALDSKRAAYWKTELLAALRILSDGQMSPTQLVGSWAGATGHVQFTPTSYRTYAVDFDRDGKRDIWGSLPDALASAANYLKSAGWVTGRPWGFEVELPASFDYGLTGPGHGQLWMQWQALGVRSIEGLTLPPDLGELTFLLPAGASGPAFLTTGNFRAILRYNNSISYALAVAHLSDRIAGRGPTRSAWPACDKGLNLAQREELQRLLTARGLDTGGIDGIFGPDTRAAIRRYQKSHKLPEDGYPSADLLLRLKQVPPD